MTRPKGSQSVYSQPVKNINFKIAATLDDTGRETQKQLWIHFQSIVKGERLSKTALGWITDVLNP